MLHHAIIQALKDLRSGCTPENFAEQNAPWVDDVCESHDGMGTLQGWAFRMDGGDEDPSGIPAVDLVFEHGIVSAYLESLVVFAERPLYTLDD